MIDCRGRVLTPCRRKVAEREVRLNRAKWVGKNRIRLRFDPFAYRYVRLKVLARDHYTCYWCGRPGDTIDHIIPWSQGGRTTMANCITACRECNGQRGNMPAEAFARLKGVPTPSPGAQAPLSPSPAARKAAAPGAPPPRAGGSAACQAGRGEPRPSLALAPAELAAAVRAQRVLRLARLLEGAWLRQAWL